MQITVTVADKLIKTSIGEAINNSVYESYDQNTLKAAKLPKTSDLIKEIFEDAKFQKNLVKYLNEIATEAIEDRIYDDLCYDVEMPLLDSLKAKLDAVSEEEQAVYRQEQEAKEVERMVNALKKAGYNITKS